MGCNCTKRYDQMKKFSEDGDVIDAKDSVLGRLFHFIGQLLFGIIAAALFIIMVIPLLVYVMACIVLGRTPSVRIYNWSKRLREFKNGR